MQSSYSLDVQLPHLSGHPSFLAHLHNSLLNREMNREMRSGLCEGCAHEGVIVLDLKPRRASSGSPPYGVPSIGGEAHPPLTCESPKGLVLKQTIEEPSRARLETQVSHLLSAQSAFVHAGSHIRSIFCALVFCCCTASA